MNWVKIHFAMRYPVMFQPLVGKPRAEFFLLAHQEPDPLRAENVNLMVELAPSALDQKPHFLMSLFEICKQIK